jgi:hypothetical protein
VVQFFPWAHQSISFSSLSEASVITKEKIAHTILGDGTSRLAWLDKEPSSDDLILFNLPNTFSSLLEDFTISHRVENFLSVLTDSVECRVRKHPEVCKKCVETSVTCASNCDHCCVAVLFSGGLDSTILALLAHKFVPDKKPIDLYNVSFQQQNGSFDVPDRLTGRVSHKELEVLAPNRQWNFIEVCIILLFCTFEN